MENLSENIKNLFGEMIDDGTFESILKERMKKGIEDAFDHSIRFGVVRDAIEKRIKEVLVPNIERYNFNDFIIKLDSVLTEIVNTTNLKNNREILNNFKFLMLEPDCKDIKISKIFNDYMNFISENLDCDGREVDLDDGPTYECICVGFRVDFESVRSWSCFEYATIEFFVDEEEHQKDLNRTVKIYRFKSDKSWKITSDKIGDIYSLRHLKDFDVLIHRLARAQTTIEINIDGDEDYVIPQQEPECTFS